MIQQLEKSQDMLMNFQQELNVTEQELQRQREENKRYVLIDYQYLFEYTNTRIMFNFKNEI